MSVARGMYKVERVPEQIDRVPIKRHGLGFGVFGFCVWGKP